MLRINLLPPYIYAGKKKTRVIVTWVLALAFVLGGFGWWYVSLGNQAKDWDTQKAALDQKANDADRFLSEAGTIDQQSQGIRDKAKFVRDSLDYNAKTYPTVIYQVRDYTIRNVLYSSLDPQGSTVSLAAYAPTLADVGHYMMWMERNPKIQNVNIGLQGLPQFPIEGPITGNQSQNTSGPRPSGGGGWDFSVQLTLRDAIVAAPTYSGGQGASGGGGTGGQGMPMGSGGMPGMMMGSGGMGPSMGGPSMASGGK